MLLEKKELVQYGLGLDILGVISDKACPISITVAIRVSV